MLRRTAQRDWGLLTGTPRFFPEQRERARNGKSEQDLQALCNFLRGRPHPTGIADQIENRRSQRQLRGSVVPREAGVVERACLGADGLADHGHQAIVEGRAKACRRWKDGRTEHCLITVATTHG